MANKNPVIAPAPKANSNNLGINTLRPCKINTGTSITHNKITWNFNAPVTWGRYVSGDPWVLVEGNDVQITSITPGLSLVAGTAVPVAGPNSAGITFWINGSIKNPIPAIMRVQNPNYFGLTFPNQTFRLDQRVGPRLSGIDFSGAIGNSTFDYSLLLQTPAALTHGDIVVSANSKFDPLEPQVKSNGTSYSRTARYTPVSYRGIRTPLESMAFLTAVDSIPECDEYRPPLIWAGLSLADRPIFKESEYAKNINKYQIEITDSQNIFGQTYTQELYNEKVSNWNDDLNKLWPSSFYVNNDNWTSQGGWDLISLFGDEHLNYDTYFGTIKDNLLEPFIYSIFAPWVPPQLKLKALRRITQYGIDSYGWYMAGGRAVSAGGHHQALHNPFIRFVGWLFENNQILNYDQYIPFNPTKVNTMSSGTVGGRLSPKGLVDLNYLHKNLLLSEYQQHIQIKGLGSTGPFVMTNPDIELPWYTGMTGISNGLTVIKDQAGATGVGWAFKLSGLTLDPTTPFEIVDSITKSWGHVNDFNPEELNSKIIYGTFGKLNFTHNFIPRSRAARDKMLIGDNPRLGYGPYLNVNWILGAKDAEFSDTYVGQYLKIIGGSGAGDTEYRILEADGFNEATGIFVPGGVTYNQYQPYVILDRPFQHGDPSTTSVINMYPYSKNDSYPIHGFKEHYWYATGVSGNSIDLGSAVPYLITNRQYSMQSGPHVFSAYSLMKYLGITQDQYLIDLFYDTMYDPTGKYPKFAKTSKIAPYQPYGIDTLSNILVKYMWGASGGNIDIGTIGNRGISGESVPESSGLRRLRAPLEEYSFNPAPVSFTASDGTTISGSGVEYTSPNSSFGINKIVDGSFYFNVDGYDFTDPDSEQFPLPSLYMNSVPANLGLDEEYKQDGKFDTYYTYPNVGPYFGPTADQISYVVTDGDVMQHSVQTVLPASGLTGAAYVVSVIPINYINRRRDTILIGLGDFNLIGDSGYTMENDGMTYDAQSYDLNPVGDFAYVNIAGSVINANDWERVPMGVNGNIISLDISEHSRNLPAFVNQPMSIRFFTNRINVFAHEMNEDIKFRQNNGVYSK